MSRPRWTVHDAPDDNTHTGRAVWLYDDDFTHDASLRIHGDFADHAEHMAYAQHVADMLNAFENAG